MQTHPSRLSQSSYNPFSSYGDPSPSKISPANKMVLRPCQKLCHSGLTILPSKLPIRITSTQGLGRVRLRQWLRGQHGQHVPGRLGRARARYQHRRGSCHLVRRLIEIECMAVVGRQSRARMCVCHACRGNLLLCLCLCCVSVSRTLLCGRRRNSSL